MKLKKLIKYIKYEDNYEMSLISHVLMDLVTLALHAKVKGLDVILNNLIDYEDGSW